VAIAAQGRFEALALGEDALFLHNGSFPGELLRILKVGFNSAVLAQNVNALGGTILVEGGYVYLNAQYAPAGGTRSLALVRVPVSGGAPELVHDPHPGENTVIDFNVIDGNAYLFGDDLMGVVQVPIVGGTATTLFSDTVVHSIVADSTHFYYQRGFSEFDIMRSPRADTSQLQPVFGQQFSDSVIAADLFLEADHPDHLYFADGGYSRVLKTGGTPEPVVDGRFGIVGAAAGPDYLLIGQSYENQRGTFAVPRGGGEVLRIEAESTYLSLLAEDATHFYLAPAGGRAIFRIAKP
jgi:hypothetical protein